jgi:hypothetical protein
MAKWWLKLAVVVGCAACGSGLSSAPSTGTQPADPIAGTRPVIVGAAPVVVVRAGTSHVEVAATRWSGVYFEADGTRPTRPVELGPSAEIIVEFAKPDIAFEASLQPVDGGQRFATPLTKVDATTFRLDANGHAGVFDVALFGQSPTGVVEVWVRWHATL